MVLDSGTAILNASGGEQARFPADEDPALFDQAIAALDRPRPRFAHYRTNVIAFWVILYPALFWYSERVWLLLKKLFS